MRIRKEMIRLKICRVYHNALIKFLSNLGTSIFLYFYIPTLNATCSKVNFSRKNLSLSLCYWTPQTDSGWNVISFEKRKIQSKFPSIFRPTNSQRFWEIASMLHNAIQMSPHSKTYHQVPHLSVLTTLVPDPRVNLTQLHIQQKSHKAFHLV